MRLLNFPSARACINLPWEKLLNAVIQEWIWELSLSPMIQDKFVILFVAGSILDQAVSKVLTKIAIKEFVNLLFNQGSL